MDALIASLSSDFHWQPFPGSPQEHAYHCTADVIGYGGAAGGGKTDLALGKAFTQFYRAIIFRREYPQLEGIIIRGDEIQDGRCRYIAGEKKHWSTPDGRIVKLGSLEHEKDVLKYKGRPRDFVVFDEAADFTEYMVRFILGWLRTERSDIRPQALLTFNPPTTPEGEWIVKYFAPWLDPDYKGAPAEPGELRYFIRVDDKDVEVETSAPVPLDGKTYYPQSRTFFRALVEDNPVYMATGYDKQLESLFEPLRSQLRWGDFTATAQDDIWQVIPSAWIIAAQNRWLEQGKPELALRSMGIDPSRGGGDEFVIAKLYGVWFDNPIAYPGVDAPDGIIGARYVTDALGVEDAPLWIDVIGIGSSVYDQLKVIPGVRVTPVNVGEGSTQVDKTGRYQFADLRSQIWWQFREALDPNSGENIALPPHPKLRTDLRTPRFKIQGGKIKVESKDDIRKRISRSTDYADAYLLAWHGIITGTLGKAYFF